MSIFIGASDLISCLLFFGGYKSMNLWKEWFSLAKMFLKFTAVFVCLGFVALSGAYNITSNVVDGIPEALNITTEPFVKIGNGYYYIEGKVRRNWYEAHESCRRLDADLIAFETIEEWDSVREYMWAHVLTDRYWNAGNNLANVDKHVWHNTGEPVALDIWSPGKPKYKIGVERCDDVWYSRAREFDLLNDQNCSAQSFYICEAPQPKTASFIIW